MKSAPPLVDQFGNINLHMEQDLIVPLQGGVNVGDLSARNLLFTISVRGVRHVPVANPADAQGRLINIPAAQLKAVRTGDSFALIDRTNGSKVRWEGTITRRG
jgi:hypothetical protein